ncbi:MauE/DoxX family redox-associated membrane protein [Longitalea luteola]|uniref:MauE/DoxX family redox-associated membrane protein n=1 Tax=Longitalea luteola TaxID=2812563 RepID=UPI0034E2609A
MIKSNVNKTVIETIVFLYAILFLYSGISKLTEFNVFKQQLSESPILGPISSLVAVALPWIEFLIVIMLIIPKWRLKGFYAALVLMASFTLYIILLLSISDKLPCSCGGVLSELSWTQHIVLNGIYILICVIGIILQRKHIQKINKTWELVATILPLLSIYL